MKERTCCFIGHRKIEDTLELRTELYDVIEKLIVYENIYTFLFGSKSGTKIALDYAVRHKKQIIKFPKANID